MRTIIVDPDHMGYAEVVDILYVTFSDYSLNGTMSQIEDVGPYISVFYGMDGSLVGIEFYDFIAKFGKPPMKLLIPARDPFYVEIPALSAKPALATI